MHNKSMKVWNDKFLGDERNPESIKIAQMNFEIRVLHQSSSIFDHVHKWCESPNASSSRPTVGQHLPRAAGRSHSYSYEFANTPCWKATKLNSSVWRHNHKTEYHRENCRFTRVGTLPLVEQNVLEWMRGHLSSA